MDWTPFVFLENELQSVKNVSLVTQNTTVLYTVLAKRLAKPFYNAQLVDIFAYEKSNTDSTNSKSSGHKKYNYGTKVDTPILVYNFHTLFSQNRLYLFAVSASVRLRALALGASNAIESVSELFMSANWLEREVSELHGVVFNAKKDLRNLMLQFGDLSAPLQKWFPSTGFRDLIYDSLKDTLISIGSSVQT